MTGSFVGTKSITVVVMAASIMAAVGAAVFLLLPIIIGAAMDALALSEEQAGLLASSYFTGYLGACIAAFSLVQRVSHKTLASGSYIALSLSLILAALSVNTIAIAIFMAAAGAGAGMLFGLAILMMGQTANADRNFGILLVAQQLFAAALLFVLPQLVIPVWGFSGMMLVLGIVLGIGLLTINNIDDIDNETANRRHSDPSSGLAKAESSCRPIMISLGALTLHFAALSAVWGFIERIAVDQDLQLGQIGTALALSMLGGVIGGLLVAVLGVRLGRVIPIWISLAAFLAVFYGYSIAFSMLGFAFITFNFSLFWNYILGYQMAIIAELDGDNRYAVLIPAAQALGALAGPGAAGIIIVSQGYTTLLIAAAATVLITSGLFLHLLKRGNRYD